MQPQTEAAAASTQITPSIIRRPRHPPSHQPEEHFRNEPEVRGLEVLHGYESGIAQRPHHLRKI